MNAKNKTGKLWFLNATLFAILTMTYAAGYIKGKNSANAELNQEHEYCNAWMELCHHYLYDNNPAHPGEPIEKNNYWYDVVMESDYYQKIDSLNEGYWEDWYCNWEK